MFEKSTNYQSNGSNNNLEMQKNWCALRKLYMRLPGDDDGGTIAEMCWGHDHNFDLICSDVETDRPIVSSFRARLIR